MILIGTAGWSLPKQFSQEKTPQLQIYSHILSCVEINSTFYKDPMKKTLEKWKNLTAENFSFSLKLHQKFTHLCDLNPPAGELKKTLKLYKTLGDKLGCVLLQFPPKMIFQEKKMARFYSLIRQAYEGAVVIEPRNETWLCKESVALMKEFSISKVIADPEKCPGKKYNFSGLKYFRLHGAPVIYRSSYSEKYLRELALEIQDGKQAGKQDVWVIFDNTASGAGLLNALSLNKKSRP